LSLWGEGRTREWEGRGEEEEEGDVEVRKGVGGRDGLGAMEREGPGGLVPGRVRGGRGRG
jgi:hypothetical protein